MILIQINDITTIKINIFIDTILWNVKGHYRFNSE